MSPRLATALGDVVCSMLCFVASDSGDRGNSPLKA
jgi:hypothetical protein